MESFRRRISGIYALTSPPPPQVIIQSDTTSTGTTESDISTDEHGNAIDMTQQSATPSQKYWMPDSVSTKCYDCEAKFTTFRRRHHCRVCGQIFCSKCCGNYIPGESIGCQGNMMISKFPFIELIKINYIKPQIQVGANFLILCRKRSRLQVLR